MGAGEDNDCFALDDEPEQVGKAAQHHASDRAIDFLVAKRRAFKLPQSMPKLIAKGPANPRLSQLIPRLCFDCVQLSLATDVDAVTQGRLRRMRACTSRQGL